MMPRAVHNWLARVAMRGLSRVVCGKRAFLIDTSSGLSVFGVGRISEIVPMKNSRGKIYHFNVVWQGDTDPPVRHYPIAAVSHREKYGLVIDIARVKGFPQTH